MARYSYRDELSSLENNYGRLDGLEFDPKTGEWVKVGKSRQELLDDYQEQANKLNAISGVYQRADRIITGDSDITVTVVDDPTLDTNAQNNGKEIVFNANLIEDLDSDSIISLHGLNYHEVGHILFSPRAGSNLGQFIKNNSYMRASNLLEEARSEALLTAKYPTTRLFLEASTTAYILKGNPSEWADDFLTITGRTYLPLELRQVIADKFIAKYGSELAREIHGLIHAYRTLVFPTDFDKAKELIVRMADIVGRDEEQPKHPKWDSSEGSMSKGRPAGVKEQEYLQGKHAKSNPSTENLNSKSVEVGLGAGSDSTELSEKEQRESTEDDSAITKKLNERMKLIKSDSRIKREITDTRKAIFGSDEVRSVIKEASYVDKIPSTGSISLARKFGTELERIVRNQEPNWNKYLPSGKLNITRTMNPNVNAISTHFDRWDTGNPNTDIEAVILMDNSSSMGYVMGKVCENSWIIKRGIEAIEGDVTIFSFNHESKAIYNSKEKAKGNAYRYLYSGGSTNPIRGLIEAERILTMSKKSIKLLFIVTDGEWELEEECDNIIASLNNKGTITSVVFLGDVDYYKNLLENNDPEMIEYTTKRLNAIRHGAKVFHAVEQPRDVLNVATALVKEAIKG